MQAIATIVRQPILAGLLLSVVAHMAILHRHAIIAPLHTTPIPELESGRTAVQLTLMTTASEVHMPQEEPLPAPEQNQPLQKAAVEPVATNAVPPSAPREPNTATVPTEDTGITSEAVVVGTYHPVYPHISTRRREEGSVMISVQVLSNGTPGIVEILESSGYRRLDQAAIDGVGKTTFKPALQDGLPVESTTELTYTFRLTDD